MCLGGFSGCGKSWKLTQRSERHLGAHLPGDRGLGRVVCDCSRLEAQQGSPWHVRKSNRNLRLNPRERRWGRFCEQESMVPEETLRSGLTPPSQASALPVPWAAGHHSGSLARRSAQRVVVGRRWPSHSCHLVHARVRTAVSLTRAPHTRSSLLSLTHSRSVSARTHSSCWCGWWMNSGECLLPWARRVPAGGGFSADPGIPSRPACFSQAVCPQFRQGSLQPDPWGNDPPRRPAPAHSLISWGPPSRLGLALLCALLSSPCPPDMALSTSIS